MASYSSNANVQNLVYGTTNSELDTASSNARDIATSIINANQGYKSDFSTVPDVITRACTLIAAGFLSTGPDEDIEKNGYYKSGMLLLESLGEETLEGDKYNTMTIGGFGRYNDINTNPDIIW